MADDIEFLGNEDEDDDDGYSMEREQADFDQAELERYGAMARRLERAGICVHGWRQSYAPGIPAEFVGQIQSGQALCLYCGKVATEAELNAEREEAFDGLAQPGRDRAGLLAHKEGYR